ncbi:hypothetical protein X777_10291 [Ooceraea biroi]|uniref:DUF4218 domain-containing protein n=1 Tax=Ooceraea biroi TaxID=2015173 RepID=A0A026X144_OOCBI|nr:hypothetical protein X777_10291 [Ooceraea biroi]
MPTKKGRRVQEKKLRYQVRLAFSNNQDPFPFLQKLATLESNKILSRTHPYIVREVTIEIKKLDTGEYCHIGLIQNLQNISKFYVGTTIELNFNIDGLPLFNSTNKHFWPILGLVKKDLLSKKLVALRSFIPSEFNRKPRSLTDLCRWKATEYRSFLVYLGPVVLKNILDISIYEHFLLFHSTISIHLSKHNINNLGLPLAQELLETFIEHAEKIYGLEFYVYNVHILCHLTSDVQMYGPLDNCSCFPYENYLGKLKKLIKSSRKPLEQVCRRLREISFSNNDCHKPNYPILKHFIEHNNGPLLNNINVFKQFKKISIRNYVSSTHSSCVADSYFLSKTNEVVQINNIILATNGSIKLIGKRYMLSESLYLYPFDSKKLNIFCVTKVSEQLQAWNIDNIKAKCILLPLHDENWACFPLLHT